MYKVTLSACGNIDFNENPYDNIINGFKVPSQIIETHSIEECQNIVLNYIEEYCLGSGNWTGGQVYKENEQIGYISYNGRYWEKGSKYYQ